MTVSSVHVVVATAILFCLPSCRKTEAQHHEEHYEIVVTAPAEKDVVTTQRYVCQIHSQRHIEVCALERGYLEHIEVKEGDRVEQGQSLFKILPVLYKAKLDADLAEAQVAQIKLDNTRKLYNSKPPVVSYQEVALAQAELAKAQAAVALARAELNFTDIKAPFGGIVDRQHEQQGSLVEEGDVLTTLSDNDVMWVYFNVPEARYLEYMADRGQSREDQRIELLLADGSTFPYPGKIGAIEAQFNNETGNIPFRADFPNPEGLLRHGQTGTILIYHTQEDAVVIPQRATFEILDQIYVWVVGEDHVVHQRPITVQHELEDIFVVGEGLDVKDRIILDGVRQVNDGEKVEFEFISPKVALADQKFHAE